MKSYTIPAVLFLGVCLNTSGSLRALGVLGEASMANSSILGFQKQSRDLEAVEKRRLWESLKANSPYHSIDVSYTKKTVVPAAIFQKRLEKLNQIKQEMAKKHQDRWRNLEVRTQGFVNLANEHIILSRERVRIQGLKKIRIDITFFAGDTESSPKTRELVNIFHNGTFYFINKTERRIEIYDKPQFRGTRGFSMLHAGKIAGNLRITSDIMVAVDPNSAEKLKAARKNKYNYLGTVPVSGKLTEHIECVNAVDGKRRYELFVDSNDWGSCHKIVWHDIKSGQASKMIEFKDFSIVKKRNDLYPHTIIHTYFEKEGKEKRREVIRVHQVATDLPVTDESLQIKTDEFVGYEIVDYRSSPPLRTLNSAK